MMIITMRSAIVGALRPLRISNGSTATGPSTRRTPTAHPPTITRAASEGTPRQWSGAAPTTTTVGARRGRFPAATSRAYPHLRQPLRRWRATHPMSVPAAADDDDEGEDIISMPYFMKVGLTDCCTHDVAHLWRWDSKMVAICDGMEKRKIRRRFGKVLPF
ncbi:hypothetical protein EI94DRAFT_1726147 [Lactarius quietus]|nr:hypothetical protein EI94DRAFT_1726147 [Lactarius quietus]